LKGIAGYDFVISLALFAIIYLYLFNFMPFLTTGSRSSTDILLEETRQLSDEIVKSAGYPENWTSINNMEKLGLCYYNKLTYENILDEKKIEEIAGVNCSDLETKTITNMKFAIEIKTQTGPYCCPASIPPKARVMQRTAYVFDGYASTPALVKVYTWPS